MDPALLNYLQAQNNQNQGAPDNQMQGMGQAVPAPQGNYNPFDTGISRAIESARASLGMTQKQQDKAFRSSMLAFANNMSQQPKERGFFNNFASVGRALSPALSTYDQEETAALNENNALANQILKYQAQEQERQALEEQRAWQRRHAEAQLAEQQRNHNLLDRFRRDQFINREDLEKEKVSNKAWEHREKHNATKLIPEITSQYEKNSEILPTINELSKVIRNSNLSGSGKAAELKRYIARVTGNDEDLINSKNLGQFYLEWMNANSKGILSDKDIAVYSAGFADIEKNPEGSIKILNRLSDKLKRQQALYTKKLDLYEQDPGVNLSSLKILNSSQIPAQGAQGQEEGIVPDSTLSTDEPVSNDPEDYVFMRDLNGKEWEVPVDQVSLYKNNGFERLE